MGIGLATGLANGGDGLESAAYSGIATYASSKISNPIAAAVVSESIQKTPSIIEKLNKDEQKIEKK